MKTDTVINPGEKNEKANSDQPVFHLSYAGQIPYAYEHFEHRKRTNEDLERAHTLSLKQDRKSRIVWRLLYIEKRSQDLVGYMANYEKKRSGETLKAQLLALVIVINLSICLFLTISKIAAILLTIVLAVIFIYFCVEIQRPDRIRFSGRMAYWNSELYDLKAEHEELELEKEQISEEIRQLEELLS
jgi:hypothetical protein